MAQSQEADVRRLAGLESHDWTRHFALPFAAVILYFPPQQETPEIDVAGFLSSAEQTRWREIQSRAHPKRRDEWLRGRVALKTAVAQWGVANHGVEPDAAAIAIEPDNRGKPHVISLGRPDLSCPEVSLSHARGAAIALAGPRQFALGIDLEPLGRIRSDRDHFVRFALTEQERGHLPPGEPWRDAALALWVAKEAAAKALGTGLMGRPASFDVVASDSDPNSATVYHQGRQLTVRRLQLEGYWCAVAYCTAAEVDSPL